MTIIDVHEVSHTYALSENGEMLCTHEDHTIQTPCCSSGRIIECGCQGLHGVVCNNPDCTGLEQHETDELIGNYLDNLERGYDDN